MKKSSTCFWLYWVNVKTKGDIFSNFVTFLENLNFVIQTETKYRLAGRPCTKSWYILVLIGFFLAIQILLSTQNWHNKEQSQVESDRCKIPTDGVPISTKPTHIWNPWSNKTDANLVDSALPAQYECCYSSQSDEKFGECSFYNKRPNNIWESYV